MRGANAKTPKGRPQMALTTAEALGGGNNRRLQLLRKLYGSDPLPNWVASNLLTTGDVARLFQVHERTVAEWARTGRLPSLRTPGGRRRYLAEDVRRLLDNVDGASRMPASLARNR